MQEEQLNKYFDGELSAEEASILKEALSSDPELEKQLAELQEHAELHNDSIPEPKDELFIEREFQAIQQQLESGQQASEKKVVFFPGNWLRSSLATAAALLLTVAGIWGWNNYKSTGSTDFTSTMAMVETDISGASSMIYTDEQSGWTFVWIDEPENSENEIAG